MSPNQLADKFIPAFGQPCTARTTAHAISSLLLTSQPCACACLHSQLCTTPYFLLALLMPIHTAPLL